MIMEVWVAKEDQSMASSDSYDLDSGFTNKAGSGLVITAGNTKMLRLLS